MTAADVLTAAFAHSLQFDARPMSTAGEAEHFTKVTLAALASAGFAVVELPEPYIREWPTGFRADGYGLTVHDGRVFDGDDGCTGHHPDGARAIAGIWAAAAAEAEKP